MTIEPLISVGMPVYNAAPYLAEAIEGILKQTYPNFELVICDNCSTDPSPEIAQRYSREYTNIRFIQNRWNIGFAGNADKATSHCKGDLILMHAADDYLMPDAFERYVSLINENELDIDHLVLMSDFLRGDSKGNAQERLTLAGDDRTLLVIPADQPIETARTAQINGIDLLKYCFPRLGTFGGVGSVLVSRALYERVEGYLSNHWFNPDKYFLYKVLSQDPQVAWLREPLYYYRVHGSNQLGQQKATSVLKQQMDEYALTFEFTGDFYNQIPGGKEAIISRFLDYDCLSAALREIAAGNSQQGFRYLCFGLATYPDLALRDIKTYLAFLGWLLGPLGKPLYGMAYRSQIWKKWFRSG